MDFFEKYFHVSPDGGSGATEAAFIVALALIAVGLAFGGTLRRLIRRKSKSLRPPAEG